MLQEKTKTQVKVYELYRQILYKHSRTIHTQTQQQHSNYTALLPVACVAPFPTSLPTSLPPGI